MFVVLVILCYMFHTPGHHTSFPPLKIAAALEDVYPWRDNAVAEDLQVPGTIALEFWRIPFSPTTTHCYLLLLGVGGIPVYT